ncbi:hypothetical protein H2200_001227 [Cladophialophora chaetospira]|uniref:Fucose-specific lectin n=1 Tax=Cladophialophora chaetospira TaxID=386627 RepID=A0AA38XKL5_9EURO|nr:hypothetical protein H2200_001227 [Cladophialophora chaetospira]
MPPVTEDAPEGHSNAPPEHAAEQSPHTSSEPSRSTVAEPATTLAPTSETLTEQENPSEPTSDTIAEQEIAQKRLSARSFSDLPEVVPSATYEGLQAVPQEIPHGLHPVSEETYGGLQVAPKNTYPRKAVESPTVQVLPEPYKSEYGGDATTLASEPTPSEKPQPVQGLKGRLNQKVYGIRAKWLLLGVLILVLIIALGAGLGAGLSSSSKDHKDQRSGALNGTRIALATQVFAGDTEESLVMYFQHRTGQIRYMTFANGQWSGGNASTVFAHNAKMNTPIAAVSYVWNGVSFWRVFYVDVTNVIREVWGANNTQGVELGYLNSYNISPMDDDQIGMVVCWDGPTTESTYANGYGQIGDAAASLLSWRLVYASNETTFQQMTYHGDTQLYTSEQTLPNLNGHAAPACHNQGSGSVLYLMALDLQSQINVYWKDTNTDLTNTSSHPINVWTNASVAIPNVDDAATIGYTQYLYSQDKNDQLISAYNLSLAAENTSLIPGSRFTVQGIAGLPNTGLAVTARPNPAGGNDILAFYQTDGSHLGYFERDADGVSWNSANLVIPYD